MNFSEKFKKLFFYFKKYGFKNTFFKICDYYRKPYNNIFGIKNIYSPPLFIDVYNIKIKKLKKILKNKSKLKIVWITCDFNEGSGGHQTIFRFIKEFNNKGLKNEIVLWNNNDHNEYLILEKLSKFFFPLKCKIKFFPKNLSLWESFLATLDGDIIIGTDYISQYLSLCAPQFSNRYLFLQDKESLFTEYNHNSAIADHLLTLPENFICAGDWLQSITSYKKGYVFKLGVDTNVYKITNLRKNTDCLKIAIYSRWHSPRRGVDLIWEILNEISDKVESDIDIEIHCFGQIVGNTLFNFEKKFKIIDHGILSPRKINDLFNICHIGICFSLTNYSLMPLEMKAGGLEVFDLDTPSNKICFKNNDINLISPIPHVAAKSILNKIKEIKSKKFVIPNGLKIEEINELNWDKQTNRIFELLSKENKYYYSALKFKASICIPVYKGIFFLKKLIPVLNLQRNVDLELVIIETASDENINETLKNFNGKIIYKKIEKKKFNHGETRNNLVKLANSENIIFLTQDALPSSLNFASDLIQSLQVSDEIVASYCRHEAYPEHGLFIKRDIDNHFEYIHKNFPSIISIDQANKHKDLRRFMQIARFFSTNACAIKKNILKKFPFPKINYGEDQVWMSSIMQKGYKKIYINNISVIHSHDYQGEELYNMTLTDMSFHKNLFNEDIIINEMKELNLANKNDIKFANENNISLIELNKRIKRNEIYFKAKNNASLLHYVPYLK